MLFVSFAPMHQVLFHMCSFAVKSHNCIRLPLSVVFLSCSLFKYDNDNKKC